MTPEQIEARNTLDNLEAQARVHDEPADTAPLPWRVSQKGNVIAADGSLVLRPNGADKRERRRKARHLVDAANIEHVLRSEELAEALAVARARWAEVAPPEPGVIEVMGQRFEVVDTSRITAAQLTEALNVAFTGSGHVARAEGGYMHLTLAPSPVCTLELLQGVTTLQTGEGLDFSRIDFGFLAGRP